MRARILAWGIVPLLLGLAGCGPYDVPYTDTFDFYVDAVEGPLCETTSAQIIDLSKNEDFQSNRNRISRIEIDSIQVTITNPSTDPTSVATKASGKITVAATQTGAGAVTLGTYEPLTLKQGATAKVKIDQAGADKLVKLIQSSPYQAWVWAEGCVDALPAHFSFQVEVAYTVFVRIL